MLEAEIANRLADIVGQLFVILVSIEACIGYLVAHRDLFHVTGHQNEVALLRNNQDVTGKEAPVVQARQIVDVLRGGDDKAVQSEPRPWPNEPG